MNIWHISDTHTYHKQLKIPNNIDLIIHTGDASDSDITAINNNEMIDFLDWYESICPGVMKIYVPGNHDVSIARGFITDEDFIKRNLIYLNNSSIVLNNIKFYGTPYVPFISNRWEFQIKRNKSAIMWNLIDFDTEVLLLHGPPKGILDLSFGLYTNDLEQCGDKSLANRIAELKSLKYVFFGHMHDNLEGCNNYGVLKIEDKVYSNATSMVDGAFQYGIRHHGNVIKIETNE